MRSTLVPVPVLGIVVWGLATTVGCTATNYRSPDGPRYAGRGTAPPDPDPVLRVVSFNVELAREITSAIEVVTGTPELREADVVLLQEMNAGGTRAIAGALGFDWVYYPGSVSPKHDDDFGNAILSRWPIRDDRKLLLPNQALLSRTARIAVSGVVDVEGVPLRVYSAHFSVPFSVSEDGREEQARAVVEDARSHPGPVVIGGDWNSDDLPELVEAAGYSWPTKGTGRTAFVFSVDHILARGLDLAGSPPAGVVEENLDASDHRPVWATFVPALDPVDGRPDASIAIPDSTLPVEGAVWFEATLLAGGPPGEEGLRALADRGFRTILSVSEDEGDVEAETHEAERAGLDVVSIPVSDVRRPDEDTIARLLAVLADPARRPLHVHGESGWGRVGMVMALHRIEHQGWTSGAALAEMRALGGPDEGGLVEAVRGLVPRRSASR